MLDDARLISHVLVWQEGHEQGNDVPAEELCRDCPDLLPELKRRLAALRQVERFVQAAKDSTPDMAAQRPADGMEQGASLAPMAETPSDPNVTSDHVDRKGTGLPNQTGPAPATLGGYEILEKLGEGGMGVVYKARQTALKRLVALKMIRSGHAAPDQLARFRMEAEAVARLQHPNIVQIYEVGERDGQPFISLEFVDGGSLERKLRETTLPIEEAARQMEILARAMHAAHQRGIIHRDLKPANVLLSADGTLKITDFGLAKRLDEDIGQTQSGAVMGSPPYMAPEQALARSEAIGPVSDVYALGVILYEMLTGRTPFRGANVLETLEQVCRQEPVPPSRLQPKVPRDLETICLKCLQKEPGKRYASAEALADDLRRFQAHQPIQARPVSAWERTVKWARRQPVAAALVGASLLAACALVAFSVLYGVYASQRADRYKELAQKLRDQDEVRERSSKIFLRAQQHEAAKNWVAANTELEKAQEALDAQPELRADELRAEVRRRLAIVRHELREQEHGQQAQKRRRDLQDPHNDALFYYTLFTGMDAGDNRANALAATRTGLAVYGLEAAAVLTNGGLTLLERDWPYLKAAEQTEVAGACYELLLIWADLEATRLPGRPQPEAQGRERAAKALALLARAARFGQAHGLETRTYHLRKGRYTARSKGEAFDPAALGPAVPARPTGPLDWFLEGLDAYRAGHYEQARQACHEVLEKQESHFWGRYVQGLCELHLGRWVEAKASLTICMNLRRQFVWPRLLRGFAASELGQKHKDVKLAEAEFDAAEADFDLALKQNPDPVVQYVGLANRGALNIRRRQWARAAADLRQAIRVKPGWFPGYVNLAIALEGQKKWPEALAALDQAIQRAPAMGELYESRARLHLLRQEWAAARVDFERALAREKDSTSDHLVSSLVELGKLLQRERKYEEALASFDRALALKPAFVLTQRFRAEALLALNRSAEAGAALDYYLAVTKPAPAEVYQARGLIYAGMGKLPAAIEMYTLALRQRPTDTLTRSYRGWTYLLTDAVRLALEDFEACLREDATNADALSGRANARIRLRRLDEGLEDARSAEKAAAEQDKITDRLLYNLTRLYAQAVGLLELESRTTRPGLDPATAPRVILCRAKAFDCLLQALDKLPPERRSAFWRNQIENDPGLTAIRRGSRYAELEARYGGKGS